MPQGGERRVTSGKKKFGMDELASLEKRMNFMSEIVVCNCLEPSGLVQADCR